MFSWREKRMRERGEIPLMSSLSGKVKINKKARNQKLQEELSCVNCRRNLKEEVWQCENGHSVCEDCFDKESFKEDEEKADNAFQNKGFNTLKKYFETEKGQEEDQVSISSISSFLARTEDMNDTWEFIKNREKTNIEEESEGSSVILEKGSYVRPDIVEVDFITGTLDIRSDAIAGYADYNEHLQRKEEEEEIDLKLGVSSRESEDEGSFVSEETTLPDYEESVIELQLHPKTLSQLILEDEMKESQLNGEEEKYKKRLQKHIRKIDFFRNTLKIRKDAITTYDDYNENLLENSEDSSTAKEDSEDTDDEGSNNSQVSDCPICIKPIEERNQSLEQVLAVFNKMMIHRNKL